MPDRGTEQPVSTACRPLAQQLIEQLSAHVHKEEGILVPLLQDSMDGDAEERLYSEYAMGT